jgi:ABC-type multidrug transport system fused ATPase/permease subunit
MHGRALFAALGFIGALATALVYLVGGRIVIADPAVQVGTVVALGMYVTQLYGPLAQLSNARVDLMTALVSFERVFEVLDLPRTIEEREDAVELHDPSATSLRAGLVPLPGGDRVVARVAGGPAVRARGRGVGLDPARPRPRPAARAR